MAAALLGERLARRDIAAEIASAGLIDTGSPASDATAWVLDNRGIDVGQHRSRRLDRDSLADRDLVIGLERRHVREAVVLEPEVWSRSFTLKELVRRGEAIGPRRADEPLEEWLARAHFGREHRDLLGASPDDDVADPHGGTPAEHERTAVELDDLIDRLVTLAWAPPPT
jgi:protein-tyrosine-phosphatase